VSSAVPDAIEPLVGWRYWRLDRAGRLTSLGAGRQLWEPGRALRARCRHERIDPFDERWRLVDGFAYRPHRAPGEDCVCGIHAARDLASLRSQRLFGLRYDAAGEVSVWGKVIPGELACRAELAYPKSIYVIRSRHADDERTVAALSAYGVAVDLVSHRDVCFSLALALRRQLGRVAPAGTGRLHERSRW
jgi:hypothetical protein